MKFRKDINGLRSIAVIAVVLFHFNANLMPGGFAGVDVFFVISGFLMTGIIFRGIEQENFSILKFYVARANRIIPALAVLCLVLLVFGWYYLTPLDYKALGKHVGSSMGFLSNVIYWRESGYFDTASHEKWLLHTWSLSVEWQFYIIYPLILVAMRMFMSLKAMKTTILFGTLLGFVFCVIATYKWVNFAYYLLPTRAWEMMIGGVAYLYPLKFIENRNKVFEWVGLTLIIVSYIFISKENLWPGYLALTPVLGAFLIIQSQRNDSILTGNVIFQSLGKWSYSIYIWHWPLVVSIHYFSLDEIFIYLGIILSVIIGFISYKYIESINFKVDFREKVDYLNCKPIYLVVIIGFTSSCVFLTKGVISHYPKKVILASSEAENYSPYRDLCFRDEQICYFIGNKIVDKLTNVDYIIFGDSHSLAQLSAVLDSVSHDKKSIYIGSSACLFIPDLESSNYDISSCQKKTKELYNKIIPNNKLAKLIMIQRLNIYFSGYNSNESEKKNRDIRHVYKNKRTVKEQYVKSLCEISKKNDIYITTPTPEFLYDIPSETSKRLMKNNEEPIRITLDEYNNRNKTTKELLKELQTCNIKLMSPTNYLCNKDGCFASKDGRPIYKDDDHLSEYGNKLLIPMFSLLLEQ